MKSTSTRLLGILLVAMLLVGFEGCGKRRPTMQQDGGTTLSYQVESDDWKSADPSKKESLEQAVRDRLQQFSRDGVEVDIDQAGKVVIAVPGDRPELVTQVKNLVGVTGELEFLIAANEVDHASLIEAARESKEDLVRDQGSVVGKWVPVGKVKVASKPAELRATLSGLIVRDADTKEPLEIPAEASQVGPGGAGNELRWLESQQIASVEVLLVVDPDDAKNVRGHLLKDARTGFDDSARPCVNLTMSSQGGALLKALSAAHLPDEQTGRKRQLAVVFDHEIISTPMIQSTFAADVSLSGRFTLPEVNEMVAILRAGTLPARLSKQPAVETKVPPQK